MTRALPPRLQIQSNLYFASDGWFKSPPCVRDVICRPTYDVICRPTYDVICRPTYTRSQKCVTVRHSTRFTFDRNVITGAFLLGAWGIPQRGRTLHGERRK